MIKECFNVFMYDESGKKNTAEENVFQDFSEVISRFFVPAPWKNLFSEVYASVDFLNQ